VTVTFVVDARGGGRISNNLLNLFSLAARVTSTSRDSAQANNIASVSTVVTVPTCFGWPAGPTVLIGTPGDDRLAGSTRADRICGRGGNDTIVGGDGNDLLSGGSGKDRIVGGGGTDRLDGGAGNDALFARDTLRDLVYGGLGIDVATVDRGRDVVKGVEVRL
jgi:Ca2+-binding RTX toxin-like protein